ncbi:MAG: bifunctional diguanylate cyclase/phosphodiesterase [Ardenticatenaceae bacterium]
MSKQSILSEFALHLPDERATQEAFERLTRLTRATMNVPLVLLLVGNQTMTLFEATSRLPSASGDYESTRSTDSSHLRRLCQEVIASSHPFVTHSRDTRSDWREQGAVEPFSFAAVPLVTDSGVVVGALGVCGKADLWREEQILLLRDLAASATSECSLYLLKIEQAVAAAEGSVIPYLASPDRRLFYVSSQIQSLLGFSPVEWLHSPMSVIDPPLDANEDKVGRERRTVPDLYLNRTAGEESFRDEYQLMTRDGSLLWVEDQRWLLRHQSGQTGFLLGWLRDITQDKPIRQNTPGTQTTSPQYTEVASLTATFLSDDRAAIMPATLRTLLKNVRQAIILVNPEYKLRAFNSLVGSNLQKIYGTDSPFSSSILHVIPPEEQPRFQRRFERALMGFPQTIERKYQDENEEMWAEFYYDPILLPNGETLGIAFIARDITERKRAEVALRESEERYRQLVEHFPETIVVHREGQIVYINPAGATLLGAASSHELIGEPFLKFVYPEERASASQVATNPSSETSKRPQGEQEANAGVAFMQHKLVGLDGKPIEVLMREIPINFESQPATQSVMIDMRERLKSEKALRESENRFRALVENSSDAIVLMSATGQILYVGPSTNRILKYNEGEMLGRSPIEFIHPDDLQRTMMQLGKLLQKPGDIMKDEYRLRSKDGTWRWVEGVAKNALNEPGLEALILNHRDITERKEAEEIRRKNEEKLRRHNKYLATLHETTLAVMNRLNLDELLSGLVTQIAQLVGTSHGFIFLIEEDVAQLKAEMKFGIGAYERYVGKRIAKGEGLSGQVWERGEPLVVDHNSASADTKQSADLFRVTLGVPLFSGAEVIGIIGLARMESGRTFAKEEVELVQRFAQLASIALDNARLYSAAQQELSERTRAEGALRVSQERYALAADGANDGLWDWNLQSNELYLSTRWKAMLGYTVREIGKRPTDWFERVHPEDITQLNQKLNAHLQGQTAHFEDEHRVRHQDGSYRWMLSRGLAVRNQLGQAYRMAGSQTDVTQRKEHEEQLLYQAFHDPLTALPNRALFMQELEEAIGDTRDSQHQSINGSRSEARFAVLYLDFDRFKLINDSYGHLVGDQLLIKIARRLEECLKQGDIVARLGGDEFTILLKEINDINDPITLAERIQQMLMLPFKLNGQEIFISTSIGIVLTEAEQYEQPEYILRDADIAMYQAKAQGKARHELFDQNMHLAAMALLQLENDLRRAIERKEFLLHYQPLVSMENGQPIGFEALVRWQHPTRGMVSPGEFIPAAEETGLIVPLGEWVLRTACQQMSQWLAQFSDNPQLTMSVNLSSKQLTKLDLAPKVATVLQETGLKARNLKLEITESVMMEQTESANATLAELRALGIELQLDDFGTGYSSLGYLQKLPVGTIKIDRSFIRHIEASREHVEIVRTIVMLARNLSMKVVAEGIETQEQQKLLTTLGCDYGQGYLFAAPLSSIAAERLLTKSLC